MAFTDGQPSPPLFRFWAALSALAGAVERRVWVYSSRKFLYPNMFVLLTAPPGVGKDIISTTEDALRDAQAGFYLAPTDLSKASMLDALSRARRDEKAPTGEPDTFHYLNVCAEEFGVFVPEYNMNLLSVLSTLYVAKKVYEEERRGRKADANDSKVLIIQKPLINMIAGAQPGYLASLLPEAAWQQGFMSRMIMVYSAMPINVPLFGCGTPDYGLWQKLCQYLKRLSVVKGEFTWKADAAAAIEAWKASGMKPAPDHTRLTHYNARRIMHLLKLCMLMSLSRGTDLVITLADYNRAKRVLLEVEAKMPDIFRDMMQHPDAKILEELQIWAWTTYFSQAQAPISKEQVLTFLSNCMPSEKVQRMFDLAVETSRINKMAGQDLYLPSDKGKEGKP